MRTRGQEAPYGLPGCGDKLGISFTRLFFFFFFVVVLSCRCSDRRCRQIQCIEHASSWRLRQAVELQEIRTPRGFCGGVAILEVVLFENGAPCIERTRLGRFVVVGTGRSQPIILPTADSHGP
jgi:hypothetical protein